MKEETNAKSAMQRSLIELCTLAILAKHDAYTNDIVQLLRDNDIIVVEGSIYPLLSNLKKLGLLSYRWEESAQGPPRKYYNLTEEGKSYFAHWCADWDKLVASVDFLLGRTTTKTSQEKVENEEKK